MIGLLVRVHFCLHHKTNKKCRFWIVLTNTPICNWGSSCVGYYSVDIKAIQTILGGGAEGYGKVVGCVQPSGQQTVSVRRTARPRLSEFPCPEKEPHAVHCAVRMCTDESSYAWCSTRRAVDARPLGRTSNGIRVKLNQYYYASIEQRKGRRC